MHFPYENIDHDVETTLICMTTHLRVSLYAIISAGKVEMMASGLKGSGVKTITTHILKERRIGCATANACVWYFCTCAYWLSCRINQID